MSKDKVTVKFVVRIIITIGLGIVILLFGYSNYRHDKAAIRELKSQYTFSIRINEAGEVIKEDGSSVEESKPSDESKQELNIGIDQVADIWIKEFTGQFTQGFTPRSKTLRKVSVDELKVIDSDRNIVRVCFSARLKDPDTEYFSSWNGTITDGKIKCDWIVRFGIDNHFDGTETVYVDSIYSADTYDAQQQEAKQPQVLENAENTNVSDSTGTLNDYIIKNKTLLVTFDGKDSYIPVPVDCDNLSFEKESETKLSKGSYQINTIKTAFLYGGMKDESKDIPVTLIYSDDKGTNWITTQIDDIYDANYYYVEFFDTETGVIVLGYGQNGNQQSSRIYVTHDGGETWNYTGNGPQSTPLKGVKYLSETRGFFCYDYLEGMESNLLMTNDAGKTFSKVMLQSQELDSTAANSQGNTQTGADIDEGATQKLQWRDVYKEALVPFSDENGSLIVYLTQGSNGKYNDGKTVAKYQSDDDGSTWKYIGQMELK